MFVLVLREVVITCCVLYMYFAADPIRLVSQTGRTSMMNAGRLEIQINKQWGSICADLHFGLIEANVACRQLGYPAGATSFTYSGLLG